MSYFIWHEHLITQVVKQHVPCRSWLLPLSTQCAALISMWLVYAHMMAVCLQMAWTGLERSLDSCLQCCRRCIHQDQHGCPRQSPRRWTSGATFRRWPRGVCEVGSAVSSMNHNRCVIITSSTSQHGFNWGKYFVGEQVTCVCAKDEDNPLTRFWVDKFSFLFYFYFF